MQREIKFRVWDRAENEFGDLSEYDAKFWFDRFNDKYIPDTLTIQQFTGLKDKNGIDVYEGDIVELSYKPDEHGDVERYREEVVFENGAFGDKYDYFFNYEFLPFFTIEVIGNVFENPELLR